jgi:pimeloyl-ACP methyl ester carboxylesterase
MPTTKRIKLSYRESAVGGEVKAIPFVSDTAAFASAQHIVLLIHGYNNDTAAAKEAYEGFHRRQGELDADARYGLGRSFVELYWPGDGDWGIASFLFYMKSIRHAIQTAEALAAYLAAHAAGASRIDIVAHSMGCRLAFELMRALKAQKPAPAVGRIVFMAGAVPTFMLESQKPPRRLRPAYDSVLREGARSLYSGSDMVLAFAFPAGQSLGKGEEGAWPTALGHERWVDTTVPLNLGQQENSGAGHSDYWGWNAKPKPLQRATKAATEIRDYLQFASIGSRAIADRPLEERDAVEARELAEERTLVAREITKWADS